MTPSHFQFFSPPLSHVPVSEHYQQHGMCRKGNKKNLPLFLFTHVFDILLLHAALSLTVSLSLSLFIVFVYRPGPALVLGLVTAADML